MAEILLQIWAFLQSGPGIVLVATAVLLVLNRLYRSEPAWRAYEGTIIAAVKYAEKAIPDGTENKALKRMDKALKYVLKVYSEVEGKRASPKVKAQLREGISIVHAQLESTGNNL